MIEYIKVSYPLFLLVRSPLNTCLDERTSFSANNLVSASNAEKYHYEDLNAFFVIKSETFR